MRQKKSQSLFELENYKLIKRVRIKKLLSFQLKMFKILLKIKLHCVAN